MFWNKRKKSICERKGHQFLKLDKYSDAVKSFNEHYEDGTIVKQYWKVTGKDGARYDLEANVILDIRLRPCLICGKSLSDLDSSFKGIAGQKPILRIVQ